MVCLDVPQAVERDHQDEINEEAKKMERLANKRSLLLKKVCSYNHLTGTDLHCEKMQSACAVEACVECTHVV